MEEISGLGVADQPLPAFTSSVFSHARIDTPA
jgi:hypothetical protein